MPDLMQRFGVELRAEVDGDAVVGHASVFGHLADVGPHYEQIEQRAFDQVLADTDTDARAFINHDPNRLLGRQAARTLDVSTDREGLRFRVELPDTSYANDLRVLVGRGDMTGGSIGFIPGDDTWSRASDGRRIRTHTSVRALRDVSIVTFPAYEGTEVFLRSLDSFGGLDLDDFEIVVLDEPPDDVDDPSDPPAEPAPEEPSEEHRSISNNSRLIQARARIHLPIKEQQQ